MYHSPSCIGARRSVSSPGQSWFWRVAEERRLLDPIVRPGRRAWMARVSRSRSRTTLAAFGRRGRRSQATTASRWRQQREPRASPRQRRLTSKTALRSDMQRRATPTLWKSSTTATAKRQAQVRQPRQRRTAHLARAPRHFSALPTCTGAPGWPQTSMEMNAFRRRSDANRALGSGRAQLRGNNVAPAAR
jgi:hypothetical protein